MKSARGLRIIGISLTAALAAVGLAACGGGGGDGTIRVTVANHVWTDVMKEKIKDFEKESGLKVELTQLGEDQLSDQYNVKLNAGSEDLDVMMYRPLQEGKLFAQNGYMADISDLVKGNAEWDWSDFQAGPVETTTFDGKVVGVPIITEREVLYYRTDLLEKSGLSVPTTLEELEAAAKKINEDNPDVAGFVARTARSAAVTQFSSFLFSQGGEFINAEGKSAIGTPEALSAYELYGRLINQYGPPNVSTDMSWSEAMAIFTQGGAAFYTEADSLYKNATDPANSKISDTVSFAPFPAGTAGSKPYNIPSWGLAISEFSKQKEDSWKFIEWATSPEMVLEMQRAGVPGPRNSVWADPAGIETYPPALAEAIAISAKNGVGQDRPLVINVPEAREIVGEPLVVGITGGDVAASLKDAAATFPASRADDNNKK